MLPGGVNLVALPTAQRDDANAQLASGFRLVDSQLEAAPAQMAADSGWIFGNGNFTIAGWQIFVPGDAQNPFTKRQRRAHGSRTSAI
jgi:hypothetical protein